MANIAYFALTRFKTGKVDGKPVYAEPGGLVPHLTDDPSAILHVRNGTVAPVLVSTLPESLQAEIEEAVEAKAAADAAQGSLLAAGPSEGDDSREGENGAQTASQEALRAEVPDGPIKDVLSWVGDDLDRAQAALDAEQAGKDPRTTLIESLEEILTA